MSKYLATVDPFEEDKNGKAKHDVNRITGAIEKLPKLVDSMVETKRKIEKEIAKSAGARGTAENAMFEDGID